MLSRNYRFQLTNTTQQQLGLIARLMQSNNRSRVCPECGLHRVQGNHNRRINGKEVCTQCATAAIMQEAMNRVSAK